MKITLGVGTRANSPPGIEVEFPDDYEITPRLWLDLQAAVIAKLQAAQAAGELADCFVGCDGDITFRKKMAQVFAEHRTKG